MSHTQLKCSEFLDALASSSSVPGGGGASALAGALGAALGSMVANLTLTNAKYADVHGETAELLKSADALRGEFLRLADADADVFAKVIEAMQMPRATDDEKSLRSAAMETALANSAAVPMAMAQRCVEMLRVAARINEIGSAGVISDAGCSAAMCAAALEGAALNVYANTKYMKDRETAESLNARVGTLKAEGLALARAVTASVEEKLR